MSSVGPQLPPHLAKRKRSRDEVEHPSSPPRKIIAAAAPHTIGPSLPPSRDPDELDVDDSSEADDGPSILKSKPTSRPVPAAVPRVLGPSLPSTTNPDELALSSDSDSEESPKPRTSKFSKTISPPLQRRILGPAPPPASLSEQPSQATQAYGSSASDSEEDDYGPSLPPVPGSNAASELQKLQTSQSHTLTSIHQAPKAQRDDWMLLPPSSSDWTSRVDPTKLRARKFATGKGSKAPAEKSGISAIWTETPEQKRQRLEDEVLGRADPSSISSSHRKPAPVESKEEAETARRIREYNEKNRSRSLYKEHEEKEGKTIRETEDDPSKRGFDREKDMALGGRLGHGQKKEMLAKAADFGSRFQRGKYL